MIHIDWGLVNIGIFFAALVMCAIYIFTDGSTRLVCGISTILLDLTGWIMLFVRMLFKR
jgi:hypothetical protein